MLVFVYKLRVGIECMYIYIYKTILSEGMHDVFLREKNVLNKRSV